MTSTAAALGIALVAGLIATAGLGAVWYMHESSPPPGPSAAEVPLAHRPVPPPDPLTVPDSPDAGPATPPAPSMATNAPAPVPEAVQVGQAIERPGFPLQRYAWTFQGEEFTLDLALSQAAYEAYQQAERPTHVEEIGAMLYLSPSYDLFVSEPSDDMLMQHIADLFTETAAGRGWDQHTRLSFALAFVQGLAYTVDNVTTPVDEYPRYPLETLMDHGGDCEDTSILFASLATAMGTPAVLVLTPSHMGVGLALPADGAGWIPDAASPAGGWAYVETTGSGWAIGDLPPELADEPTTVQRVDPRPAAHLDVGIGDVQGHHQAIRVDVRNLGTASAEAILAKVILHVAGTVYDQEECLWETMARGSTGWCEVWVDLGKVPRGSVPRLHVAVHADGILQDQYGTL